MTKESFFAEPPRGVDIARYFLEETDRRHEADGIELWREGSEYCYLWKYVEIDHDLRVSYLLDVRTSRENTPGQFKETRDLLFVHAGIGLTSPEVEWWNRPIRFDADREDHLDWHHDGLRWFLDRDESAMETV